ncbi:hypothetical protein CYMTET_36578, partial [Cymbomonas tetramitiformis]
RSVARASFEPLGRSLERSVARASFEPLGDSLERSVARASFEPLARSLERSVARASFEPLCSSLERSVARASFEPLGGVAAGSTGEHPQHVRQLMCSRRCFGRWRGNARSAAGASPLCGGGDPSGSAFGCCCCQYPPLPATGVRSVRGLNARCRPRVLKPTGGRMVMFMSSMPAVGYGALKPREGLGALGAGGHQAGSAPPVGSQDDKKPLTTVAPGETSEYKRIALEAAEHQVCVDLFLTTSGHIDLSSLAPLPRTTGGDIQHYHPFNFHLDAAQLYNDLHWTVVRPQGLEAVMRVRCSHGLSVSNYSGAFCKRTPTDLDLPVVDCNKAFLVTLKHDDKLTDGGEACVQCALLYTTTTGERRIRVHTLALTCTSILGNLFRSADLDVQLSTYVAQVAGSLFQGSSALATLRDQQLGKCVATLFAYRKFCATTSSTGQLILPEALKLLPLYTLALQKSIALRSDTPADERVAFLSQQLSKSAAHSVPALYPRMFALHLLGSEADSPAEAVTASSPMPQLIALSSDKLDADGRTGIFLLENGREMFIWVGRHAPASLVQALFNVETVEDVQSSSTVLVQNNTPISGKVNALVNEIRRQRCSLMRLRVVKRADPCETAFFSMLAEDRSAAGMSYVEFLCYVHRQIQNKFV